MDYKVFYRKYRPKNFNELIGQDSIKEILTNSIKTNRIAHAYIFTGPRGTGKTSTAKIFAKTLNCTNNSSGVSCDECEMCKTYNESADIIEIDAASNNGVEEIRSLRESVKVAPYNSKYKVYIIDEVHMLSNSAWNAFLKTLEEPPSHVIFILATTEINKIPETVMSRCQRYDFSRISANEMKEHLSNICIAENINIEDDALLEIVKLSNGCLRDALSYLDKISKLSDNITADIVNNNFGNLTDSTLKSLYNAIMLNDVTCINKYLDDISNSGITPLNFINDFVEYLLNKIINKTVLNNSELTNIKDLIFKLNNIIKNFNSIVNPFTLIKVELLSVNYFPGNNSVDISQMNKEIIMGNSKEMTNKEENNPVHETIEDNNNVIVKNEIKEEVNFEENIKVTNSIITDVIKKIRINNGFCNCSKELKKIFTVNFQKFMDDLNLNGDYKLIGYIENADIQVVSESNVIFSFKDISDTILFNENVKELEISFNKLNKTNYNFIALTEEEWNNEKINFINNKNRKYEYIDESKQEVEKKDENIELAEDIFGGDIVEIG